MANDFLLIYLSAVGLLVIYWLVFKIFKKKKDD